MLQEELNIIKGLINRAISDFEVKLKTEITEEIIEKAVKRIDSKLTAMAGDKDANKPEPGKKAPIKKGK